MLQVAVDWFLYTVIGLDPSIRSAQAMNFFIYDSVKILLLLFVMIFAIGYLRTYISQEKVKRWISGKKRGFGNVMASMFGAVTPFCSCSSIPIFLGFLEAFSFLITSPLVNEYIAVLMLGFFGWKITLAYVVSGMLIGIFSGLILGTMRLDKHLVTDLISSNSKVVREVQYNEVKERLAFGLNESISIIRKLWIWILVGVGIGAVIHNYVPEKAIQDIINKGGAFSVPIATIVGIPIYGNCAAIVPIAVVLFQKGVPLGTALAFMMATVALSLPEAIMLRRAMKLRLILIFFGVTALAIIFIGFLFNILQDLMIR
jgi:uncharacterized membrane protein YraQ (UPF0718 family)